MTHPFLLSYSLIFGAIAAKFAHIFDSAIIYRAFYHALVLGIGFEFVEEAIFGPSFLFVVLIAPRSTGFFSFQFFQRLHVIWVQLADSVLVCDFESWVEQWYVKVSLLAKAVEIFVILIFLVASLTFFAVNAEADGNIRDDARRILFLDI